ncbi:MAG: endonuclease/exonuclease/phosphatase family protein [Bacteroidales bacterium]
MIILNIICIGIWIIFHQLHYIIIPSIVLSFGLFLCSTLVRLPCCGANKVEKAEPHHVQMKLLSYNINLFGLNRSYKDKTTLPKIGAFIRAEKFDIACLQEFYTHDKVLTEHQIAAQMPSLTHKYIGYNVHRNPHKYGIATFSKHPIINGGCINFEESNNLAIFTDIVRASDTIRVYNLHLQSVKLHNDERSALVDEAFWSDKQKQGRTTTLHQVWSKISIAAIKRAQQVEQLAKHIKSSPYPVILCGDFNDTPISYAYQKLRGDMRDGFLDAGNGIMSTYQSFIPSFRIDYILYDQRFRAQTYYCPNITYSDHYPLICRLAQVK